jgi:hypothetical protein
MATPSRGLLESLSPNAKMVLRDLERHHEETGTSGKARLFRLFDDPYDYARELRLSTDELLAATTELYENGLAYKMDPCKGTHFKHKFALYKGYVERNLTPLASSTTTVSGQDATTSESSIVMSIPVNATPPMTPPVSHPPDTLGTPSPHLPSAPLEAPMELPDLHVHPPGRVHKLELYCDVILSPQDRHSLREASDKGRQAERNNCYGTKLQLVKWRISSKGRLTLFGMDPDGLPEALEEFGRFCEGLGMNLNVTFTSKVKCEIAYTVSGDVKKYSKCVVKVELRGYKARIFFDKSQATTSWRSTQAVKGRPRL